MPGPSLVDRLAAHETLGRAPREELEWLASHGTLRFYEQAQVVFARILNFVVTDSFERLNEHHDSYLAALQAGYIRVRPVLMTALAMIIGMAPMALGLGDGGEQNVPLGRAVIGGLMFGTVATLLFVPSVFMTIWKKRQNASP